MKSGVIWLLSAAAGVVVQATPITYTITDLGTLGGSAAANSVNANGQTAGTLTTIYGERRAYNSSTGINPAGAAESIGQSINLFGQITGTTFLNGTPYATIWTGNSPAYLASGSYGMGLNDRGQVTGMAADGRAFVSDGGALIEIGVLEGGQWSTGEAINAAGRVAGYGSTASGAFRAFTWSATTGMKQLGTLGGSNSYAFGINEAGTIAGSAQVRTGYMHAFMTSGGGLLDLGTLGGGSSFGYGINASGTVVGHSYMADGDDHAFVYMNGAMYDLNALATASGWTLTAAYGINDSGQIAGTGIVNGLEHAFLLTPVVETVAPAAPIEIYSSAVPEPSTFVLVFFSGIVAGIVHMVISRSRRGLRQKDAGPCESGNAPTPD